jgi:hypothetical protein
MERSETTAMLTMLETTTDSTTDEGSLLWHTTAP